MAGTSASNAESMDAQLRLGVWISPGLGLGYPELKATLGRLFAERVAVLPWVPAHWLDDVAALQKKFPNDLVRPYPALGSMGAFNRDHGTFIDSQPKAIAWNEIASASDRAIAKYAQDQQAAGKAELDRLIASAEFWSAAYDIAVSVRDAVPNAVGAVASNLWEGLGTKWKVILLLAAVGGIAYVSIPVIRRMRTA